MVYVYNIPRYLKYFQNTMKLTVFFTPFDNHSQRYRHVLERIVGCRVYVERKYVRILEAVAFQGPFKYYRSGVVVDAQQF